MNLELGRKDGWKYKYVELPDIKSEEDIPHYIAEAKKLFPQCKKAPKRTEVLSLENPMAQKNWEFEEVRRCIEGHNGMSGKMYFYYNYCWIQNISGGHIRPEFRMADSVWFHLVEACEWSNYLRGHGIICLKRRRSGFSWKAAADAVHDAHFHIGSNIGMTSKGERDAEILFKKVDFITTKLPSFMKVPMSSKTKEHITFARKTKDDNGNRVLTGHLSSITSYPPVDDAFEGGMFSKIQIDEAGKIDNVETIWSMGEDCLMEETARKGVAIIFGTAGNQEGNGKGQREFWVNNDAYDFVRFLFPGWTGLYVDKDGNDDIEKAVRYIWTERQKRKEGKEDKYIDYIQRYPLTAKEALLSREGSGIGHAIKIKQQYEELEANPVKSTKGKFRWGVGDEPQVVWVPNTLTEIDGQCVIYEHPDDGCDYAAGCDPADHDHVQKGASELSMYIMSRQKGARAPMIVFSYTHRPDRVKDYFDQAIMALLYYNGTKVLIENNRYSMIAYFKDNDYLSLLKEEPKQKNVFVVQKDRRFGIRKTVSSTHLMEGCINQYTSDYCFMIPDIDLLREFQAYGPETNTDRAIAFGWTLVALEEDYVSVKEKEELFDALPKWRLKKVNGKIQRVI